MAGSAPSPQSVVIDSTPDPVIYIKEPETEIDPATVFGLLASLMLIGAAVWMGGNVANFFNLPSVFIVILGTIAVTAISYTGEELNRAWETFKMSIARKTSHAETMATQLIDLSVLARKKARCRSRPMNMN